MQRKTIAIVGAGPAGLMAADQLCKHFRVDIYDWQKQAGQKFIVAGKGGLNITNSLDGEKLAAQYTPTEFMQEAILGFGSANLIHWLKEAAIETFTGSSGKVYTQTSVPPSEVLNKIKLKLINQGVNFHLKHKFISFNHDHSINIQTATGTQKIEAYRYIFSMGGASWPRTGSDANWLEAFRSKGINTLNFSASNCGIEVDWPEQFITFHDGKPLKNIRLFTTSAQSRGDAVITRYGLEGPAVYKLVPDIRKTLSTGSKSEIFLDLKPDITSENLQSRLVGTTKVNADKYMKYFNLNNTQLSLIKSFTTKEEYQAGNLARLLKNLPIPVEGLRPVAEAISSVGGVQLEELNPDFSLRKFPEIYVIGEMCDWDAPTGGFLLQGCFSMAFHAAKSIITKYGSILE